MSIITTIKTIQDIMRCGGGWGRPAHQPTGVDAVFVQDTEGTLSSCGRSTSNREENPFAWKVSVEQIRANNYNLDIKNPHQLDAAHEDLSEMLAEHQRLLADLNEVRSKLKFELMAALGGETNGVQ